MRQAVCGSISDGQADGVRWQADTVVVALGNGLDLEPNYPNGRKLQTPLGAINVYDRATEIAAPLPAALAGDGRPASIELHVPVQAVAGGAQGAAVGEGSGTVCAPLRQGRLGSSFCIARSTPLMRAPKLRASSRAPGRRYSTPAKNDQGRFETTR